MLGTESSLAAPKGIKTIRKWQQETLNQNIQQDQPKHNKKEAPALLSCLHFYFPIHVGLSTDTNGETSANRSELHLHAQEPLVSRFKEDKQSE